MPDRYQQLVTSSVGRQVADALSLPVPQPLRRYAPGQPLLEHPALVGAAAGGRLLDAVLGVLTDADADVHREPHEDETVRYGALVFDASGIDDSARLRELYTFFAAAIRRTAPNARLLVLAGATDEGSVRRRTAQRAIEGFTRSLGKELRQGSTCNLVRIAEGAEHEATSTLAFLLSARSAFVAGQVVTLRPSAGGEIVVDDPARPHTGRVALVTGAAQGIGASMAAVLARDGAHVVCADVPAQGEALARVANHVGGSTLHLDVTAEGAPQALVDHLRERHGGVDVVVHNAGITRDKTLAGMDDARWDAVLEVNLVSQERLDEALLDADLLRPGGRIVGVSSIGGIAGNRGQTNYGASKAGVIGRVEALADELADRDATSNAVAPGFIETAMTERMPVGVREAGRRMNSLNQGGRPVDVAEAVSWLADVRSGAVNGQVVRVCGQSLLGA
ncbi:3-oxoacyl-ACP reductase [Egicoccus halophilus]|uniref:3-oxoacyl-ACP reductase n=1 Tax=Egicoccus halophilus TaxID=1670830 RepID=A0A8J3EUV4_9ACTN|nr:3-oxoacyl-ACP reductase [Egicoccus halophilus]GGI06753.1 3-oxoacyl-ACP reductase [Egicoccus halophilus]